MSTGIRISSSTPPASISQFIPTHLHTSASVPFISQFIPMHPPHLSLRTIHQSVHPHASSTPQPPHHPSVSSSPRILHTSASVPSISQFIPAHPPHLSLRTIHQSVHPHASSTPQPPYHSSVSSSPRIIHTSASVPFISQFIPTHHPHLSLCTIRQSVHPHASSTPQPSYHPPSSSRFRIFTQSIRCAMIGINIKFCHLSILFILNLELVYLIVKLML